MNEYERSLDEAIAHEREVAKRNRILLDSDELVQKSYDAYFDKLKCKKCAEEHEQLAEWLEELKAIKEMDLSIPQHFTKEQSDWIKAYCIKRNIEFYNMAIDDLRNELKNHYTEYNIDCVLEDNDFYSYTTACNYLEDYIDEIAEQLKAGGEN